MKKCMSYGVIALFTSAHLVQAQECLVCDTQLSLTVDQQTCLIVHIDRYIAEAKSTGTVFIDLDTCANEGLEPEQIPTRGDPVIPDVPEPGTGPLTAESEVAILSEPQLQCIKDTLQPDPTSTLIIELTTCG